MTCGCGGGDGCGHCGDDGVRTPLPVSNRPGLDRIAYRSGRHGDFLASLVGGLSRRDRPALGRLRTRDPDDPTIALLDAWAVACDVLTFYTERLAHESYLRTATERTSLQAMGALVSYRLSPGVAAETVLAFSLERPAVLPVMEPPDPGVIPLAVPGQVVLPPRLRVQSVPGPGELPQTFETVEGIVARPEWNALSVVRTRTYLPTMTRTDLYLRGIGLNLQPGDAILFAGNDLAADRWDVRLIVEVRENPAAGHTHVRWDHGLGSYRPHNRPADAPETVVLRKRLRVFGHNAPTWKSMNQTFRADYLKQFDPAPADGADWPLFHAVTTSGSRTVLDVDGSHPDIVKGSWVVLSQDAEGFYRELYKVGERAELSRAAFGISGTVTRLSLIGEAHAFGTPRQVTVMAVPDQLTPVEAPDDSPVSGRTVVVEGDATGMAPGRTLVLAGTSTITGAPQAQVVALDGAVPAPGGRTVLTLRAALASPVVRHTAAVLGNVARATHGETVTQILGSGDARTPFLSARLAQGPLTFLPADTPRGGESTLQVTVDDVPWSEVPSTYSSGDRDRVFTTRDEPDGSVSVVFGDGHQGARTTSGSSNLRATYRKGLGASGNVRAHQLSQALDRPLGLKGVTNPSAASGGVDPETSEHARVSIPLPVRTLGRAVSLLDYADLALAFTGIGKAVATVLPLRGGRTIVVSVTDRDGEQPATTTVQRLARTLREYGDPTVRLLVLPCGRPSFRLALKVKVEPLREGAVVLAAVEAALRSAYGAATRQIGAGVHRSEVIAVAASVVGVVGVDLDLLHRAEGPAVLRDRLVADGATVRSGAPVGAELLALDPGPLTWLKEKS